MKKIYFLTRAFIEAHYKLSFSLSLVAVLVGGVSMIYSSFRILCALCFALSVVTVSRLITYKTGKIPFLMIDKTWDHYRLKYSEEEAKNKYKEMSLKVSALHFILTGFSLVVWILCEIIALITL